MYCSSWKACSASVQREGCTFYDLFIEVLQYREWQWLNTNDFTQQRYKEGIDSVNHLCSNILPGIIHSNVNLY